MSRARARLGTWWDPIRYALQIAAMGVAGTPPTHVLKPTGVARLPSGEEGLTVSDASKRAAVAAFMNG